MKAYNIQLIMSARIIKVLIVSIFVSTFHFTSVAQVAVNTLTIEEVLEMARDYSPQAILSKHQFRAAYWEHRTYKAEFLPSLTLNGTFPDFNRSLVRLQLEDGSYRYIEDYSNRTTLGLGLNQNIGFTGGRIFARSSLERTDLFKDNQGTQKSYMSTPILVGFVQPLFGFNQLKWKKKVEPLKFLEAKRTYIESTEGIAGEAIRYFFDLILAQQNLKTAQLNYANTDTLYQIASGRYNIGTIAENELLQMELSYLNAGSSVNEAEIDLQLKKFRLKSFLGLNDQYDLELVVPNYFPQAVLKYDNVLNLALNNNPRMVQYDRVLIESDRNVAQAKADRGFRADLNASFGLTQRSAEFQDVYRDPLDQQGVRIGLTVPILDWGQGRGRVKMAESSREVVRTNIQQAMIDFEQDVYLKVMQFNLQETQLQIATKADMIAQSRYNVTKERFLIGRIDVIELNIAQTERDNARTRYVSTMRNYWQFYYEMRKLSHYDFINNKPIEVDFESIIK
jgi:outer membrane protein TolC